MANAAAVNRRANSSKKAGKKSKVGLIILIVVILIVAGGVTSVALDLFGFRTQVIIPFLRNVPVVGNLMPEAEGYNDEAALDPDLVIRDLQALVDSLNRQVEQLQADNEMLYAISIGFEAELARLRLFEELHEERMSAHNEYMRALAEGEPEAFLDFIQTMHPALLEEIIREQAEGIVNDARWESYVSTWAATNPTLVAQAIETMITTDMPLIVSVMQDLPVNSRAAILGALDTDSRAAVMRQMDPR